jgi:hypothetical protein
MKATECSGTVAFSRMAFTSEGVTARLQARPNASIALARFGIDKPVVASY